MEDLKQIMMEMIQSIQNRIYAIRGERVMLDADLAELYEVATKVLNQAVKRNIQRFPSDFMFQLTKGEWEQIEAQRKTIARFPESVRSQIVTLNTRGQHLKYLPHVFTEQGIAMLSGVLHSDKAIQMNIAIMRAFIAIKRLSLQDMDLKAQLQEMKQRIGDHDAQLNELYDAMVNLLDSTAAQKTWDERDRIGFK